MKRKQLFEFHDLDWFPQSWRDLMTDLMALFESTFNPYKPVMPKITEAMAKLDCRNIVDLCSGGAAAAIRMRKYLDESGHDSIAITATDKFPNLPAFENTARATGGRIKFVEAPVDACAVPENLSGFRTMFTSFHHFPPGAAKKILGDAVKENEGIGIFEYTERTWVWVVSLLLTPLVLWLAIPFIKPFKWRRIFWALMVLPVFFGAWDGVMSCLRTYSPVELKELTKGIRAENYFWEAGRLHSFGGCYITYLLGYPDQAPRAQARSAASA